MITSRTYMQTVNSTCSAPQPHRTALKNKVLATNTTADGSCNHLCFRHFICSCHPLSYPSHPLPCLLLLPCVILLRLMSAAADTAVLCHFFLLLLPFASSFPPFFLPDVAPLSPPEPAAVPLIAASAGVLSRQACRAASTSGDTGCTCNGAKQQKRQSSLPVGTIECTDVTALLQFPASCTVRHAGPHQQQHRTLPLRDAPLPIKLPHTACMCGTQSSCFDRHVEIVTYPA